ncbi:MAG: condensation domain-containing protein, partial [Acidobacteriota bacterium]
NGRRELRIESRSESDDWRENARATVRRGSAEHAPAVVDLQGITERLAPEEPDGDAAADFYLGPRWRSIEQELWRGEAEVLTRLTLAEEFAGDFDDLPLHPALLDWATGFVRALRQELFLPVSYQRATIHGPLSREVYSHVHSLDELGQEGESLACDLDVLDDDGRVRLEVGGFVLRRASTEVTQGAGAEDQGLLSGAFHEGIRPHEGAEVFEHLLSPTVTSAQVLVSVRDFEPWLKHAREVSRQRLLEEVSKLQGRRARHTRPPLATEYAAPRNELETELCELWAELIGLDRVGIHDGFFELGGDSLLATQWIALVKERYGVELSLRSIFEVSSVARQAQLLTELRSRPDQGGRAEATIERQEGPGPFPLSFHQRQIWLYEQLRPGTPSYNVPAVLRLAGPLRVDLLEAAVGVLVARQDELRATFGQHEGNPVQTLSAEGAAEVQRIDLTDVAPEAREVIAEAEIEREIVRPFDLGRGPLLRTALLQLGAEDHLLVIVFHHLVGDHFSQQILIRELVAFYRAGFEGHAVADEDLGKLTLRYVDYAVWQDQRTGRDTMREQLAYWTSRMAGAPDGLALTTDFPRPPVKGFRGESVELDLAPELGPRLQELATQRGVTPFMVLVGAYFLLLHQHTGQDDLLVGSPITGRNAPGTQDLIGLFAAVVVLRLQLAGNPTLEQVLEQVSEVALAAYDHPELPFEELVAELGVERDLSRSPIFQTMFILQRDPHALPSLPELEIRPWRNERGTSKYDLTLFVFEGAEPGSLRGAVFEYDPGLFAKRRIEAMARDYLRCIELLVTDVELDLAQAIERLRRHGRRERARERKLPKSLPIGQAAERVALAVTANTSREKPA